MAYAEQHTEIIYDRIDDVQIDDDQPKEDAIIDDGQSMIPQEVNGRPTNIALSNIIKKLNSCSTPSKQ